MFSVGPSTTEIPWTYILRIVGTSGNLQSFTLVSVTIISLCSSDVITISPSTTLNLYYNTFSDTPPKTL